jgi:hypothetical protein
MAGMDHEMIAAVRKRPPAVADVPGVGQKLLRDCRDEDLRAIARQWSAQGTRKVFTYEQLECRVFQARDEELRRSSR